MVVNFMSDVKDVSKRVVEFLLELAILLAALTGILILFSLLSE